MTKDMTIKLLSDYLPYIDVLSTELEVELPRTLSVDFDLFLLGYGWYAPEAHSSGWFRWMGSSGRASITFVADRSLPLVVELAVYSAVDDTVLSGLRITCEGVGLEVESVQSDERISCRAIIPASLDGPRKVTSIIIEAPYSRSSELDPRYLSVAFERMEVRPLDVEVDEMEAPSNIELDVTVEGFVSSIILPERDNLLTPESLELTLGNFSASLIDNVSAYFELDDLSFGPFSGRVAFDLRDGSIGIDRAVSSGSLAYVLFPSTGSRDFRHQERHPIEASNFFGDYKFGTPNMSKLRTAFLSKIINKLLRKDFVADKTDRQSVERIISSITDAALIDFSMPQSNIFGFGSIETIGQVSGRWTVAPKARFASTRRIPARVNLEIFISAVYGDNSGKELTVTIGNDVQSILLKNAGSYSLSFDNRYPTMEVALMLPSPQSPQERGESADDRTLGVFVSSMRIERR